MGGSSSASQSKNNSTPLKTFGSSNPLDRPSQACDISRSQDVDAPSTFQDRMSVTHVGPGIAKKVDIRVTYLTSGNRGGDDEEEANLWEANEKASRA